jgi:hypothetical protein
MNDMHINMQGSESSELAKGYPGKNERPQWLINAVKEGGVFQKLSFILGLGDLVDGETLQEIENELMIIKARHRPSLLPAQGQSRSASTRRIPRMGNPVFDHV